MKKLLVLCLAILGVATFSVASAEAHEAAPVTVPVSGTTATLPATVRINDTVVVRRTHHRRYRSVRVVRYRHGRRIVTYRRVYY